MIIDNITTSNDVILINSFNIGYMQLTSGLKFRIPILNINRKTKNITDICSNKRLKDILREKRKPCYRFRERGRDVGTDNRAFRRKKLAE